MARKFELYFCPVQLLHLCSVVINVLAFKPSINVLTTYPLIKFLSHYAKLRWFSARMHHNTNHVPDCASHSLVSIEATVMVDTSEEEMKPSTNFLHKISPEISKFGKFV